MNSADGISPDSTSFHPGYQTQGHRHPGVGRDPELPMVAAFLESSPKVGCRKRLLHLLPEGDDSRDGGGRATQDAKAEGGDEGGI